MLNQCLYERDWLLPAHCLYPLVGVCRVPLMGDHIKNILKITFSKKIIWKAMQLYLPTMDSETLSFLCLYSRNPCWIVLAADIVSSSVSSSRLFERRAEELELELYSVVLLAPPLLERSVRKVANNDKLELELYSVVSLGYLFDSYLLGKPQTMIN